MMYLVLKLEKESSEISIEGIFPLYKMAVEKIEEIKAQQPEEEIIGYDEDELVVEDGIDGEIIYQILEVEGESIVIDTLTETPLVDEEGKLQYFEDDEKLEEALGEAQMPKVAHVI